MEVFKLITELDNNYSISDLGNVRNNITGRILKGYIGKVNYKKVTLTLYGNSKTHHVHLLVAKYFLNHNPSVSNLIVDHIDGDKHNNCVNNLQLITQRKNIQKSSKVRSSTYLGVSKHLKTFKACIYINKTNICLAYSSDEIYLSKVYERAVEMAHLYNGNNADFRDIVKNI